MDISIPEPGSRYMPANKEHSDNECGCCLYSASDFISNAIAGLHNGNETEWVMSNAAIAIALNLEALTAEIGAIKRIMDK